MQKQRSFTRLWCWNYWRDKLNYEFMGRFRRLNTQPRISCAFIRVVSMHLRLDTQPCISCAFGLSQCPLSLHSTTSCLNTLPSCIFSEISHHHTHCTRKPNLRLWYHLLERYPKLWAHKSTSKKPIHTCWTQLKPKIWSYWVLWSSMYIYAIFYNPSDITYLTRMWISIELGSQFHFDSSLVQSLS